MLSFKVIHLNTIILVLPNSNHNLNVIFVISTFDNICFDVHIAQIIDTKIHQVSTLKPSQAFITHHWQKQTRYSSSASSPLSDSFVII